MEKSSFKKVISKLKPKQQACCSVEIEESKEKKQTLEAKKESNNKDCY